MADPPDNYEVGYRKPPRQHQFKQGCSGNPKGRPKGAKSKPIDTGFGLSAHEAFLKIEAYRPVTIREGDRVIELPAIQAVFRAMGVSAMKGNRFAQRTLAELVGKMEAEHYRLRMEHFGEAVAYKTDWERQIANARRLGKPEPTPLPDPDDVIIDVKEGAVTYAGPMTPEDKRQWDKLIDRREAAQREITYVAEQHRRTRNPRRKEIYLNEWHHKQRMFDVINDNLPVRYRAKLENRSLRNGTTLPGDQKHNVWPE